MIGHTSRQSNLYFTPLASQVSLLKDDLLEPIDALLEDVELVELVRCRLAGRRPASKRKGRRGIAPDRLLRCCVLKHVKGWSFRELERELQANLVYRRFTRFDDDVPPDYSTFSRLFGVLGREGTRQIHARVVAMARENQVAKGRRLRTDTTVVETNVHHPTDSTLLADGVRVLTRSLKRIAEQCEDGKLKVVNHARAVKHRVLEIHRAARSFTEASREKLTDSYRKLVGITQHVTRQAAEVLAATRSGALQLLGTTQKVVVEQHLLEHFLELVQRVIAQTRARVFQGNHFVKDKVLSLFETHTQVIRKGKAHKPTEFGRLVRIDEVEGDIVSHYEVCEGNPADTEAWSPALAKHCEYFGRAPRMATADRGYYSAANEQAAKACGVVRVALPARGRLSHARAKLQKERGFKRLLRWRSGLEARIGTLKHPFSMDRATYKREAGFERYVGFCVIANNLVSIARNLVRRKNHDR